MNTYRVTYPDGSVINNQATDMRVLLEVNFQVWQWPEPIKIELVQA